MSTTLAPRIAVRKVVLGAAGKLSSGTITPAATPVIPPAVMAANVYNASAWDYTDVAGGEVMPVAAGVTEHMPGSFVTDAIFAAGTYKVVFYLAG